MKNLELRVEEAVGHFWRTRQRQAKNQGRASGRKDYGSRGAVTGGKQIDGFTRLMAELLKESGLPRDTIHIEKRQVVLPGWFRPTKEWDLIAVVDGVLLATVEFKSQVGSFGNNFNNRTEEAIGNATDIRIAYREGAFRGSPRPWSGYFMLLEDSPESRTPVEVKEPHYQVFPEFRNSSYAIDTESCVRNSCENGSTMPHVFSFPTRKADCAAFIASRQQKLAFAISPRRLLPMRWPSPDSVNERDLHAQVVAYQVFPQRYRPTSACSGPSTSPNKVDTQT